MFENDLIVVDIETTGLVPYVHEIIEIGVVLASGIDLEVYHEEEIQVIPTNLNSADQYALEVNGFLERSWSQAIDAKSALERLCALGKRKSLVAHNATFEWMFLNWGFYKHKVENSFDYHRYCTMSMFKAKNAHAKNTSLNNALATYGLNPEPDPHCALNGAKKCHELLGVILL